MRYAIYLFPALVVSLLSTSGSAQSPPGRAGHRPLLSRDIEVPLARSAAPPSVSDHARVLVLEDTAFVVADSGSNGVTCIVDRSWPASLEPQCFDAEASATILPIELRRTILYHEGHSDAEVERDIGEGLARGRFRLPRRPAVSYMMSDAQKLISDDGTPAGHWRPHIMIYYPNLTSHEVGFGPTPDMRVGMVADEGTATSSLVIIMPQFIPVTAGAR
jgi:hypothetical protein